MINTWGVCEFSEISHDPLRRWDFSCAVFTIRDPKRVESPAPACANCVHWLVADERLEGKRL